MTLQNRVRRWLGASPGGEDVHEVAAREPSPANPTAGGQVDTAFWIALGRAPGPRERRERVRALESGQGLDLLLRALLASTEFRIVYAGTTEEKTAAGTPKTSRPVSSASVPIRGSSSRLTVAS